ncbi:MAG: hypothetical protein MJZ74_06630 [Muribaculaceae bacterium]|nr:hypothetical protein [Muribaculaceae bacterium]
MRTFTTSLALMFAVFMANVSAFAMSVEQSRNEAWFLTDKMAHELNLSNYQWDDVYEVNYDFFRALGTVTSSTASIERMREQKLMYILTVAQWNEFSRTSYFTTPCVAINGHWSFTIYTRYDRNKFFDRNRNVVFSYSGNRSNDSNYYWNRHTSSAGRGNNNSSWNNGLGNNNKNNNGYNYSSNGNNKNGNNNGHSNNGGGNGNNKGNNGNVNNGHSGNNGSNGNNSTNGRKVVGQSRTPNTKNANQASTSGANSSSSTSRVAQSSRH